MGKYILRQTITCAMNYAMGEYIYRGKQELVPQIMPQENIYHDKKTCATNYAMNW